MIRRKRNHIQGLSLPNGDWCTDEEILQDEAQRYFQELFGATGTSSNPSSNLPFPIGAVPKYREMEAHNLLSPVSKEEVSKALNSIAPFKAPGVDGFQCIFFNTILPYCW